MATKTRTPKRAGASAGPRVSDDLQTPSNLYGEVLSRLRDFIVEGNLSEGSRIPERQLCEMFGISRTPLREALKALSAEGLVELLPHRGARVRQLAPEQLLELFDLIGGLEALAGRLACERITDEEIAEVARLQHEMYGHFLRRDLHKYFECNLLIHSKILEYSRNSALIATYKNLGGQLRRMRYSGNLAPTRDRWSESMREHEAIFDALQRRAGGELATLLFAHLRSKYDAAQEFLNADGSRRSDAVFEAMT